MNAAEKRQRKKAAADSSPMGEPQRLAEFITFASNKPDAPALSNWGPRPPP
jgi:hypothetical protein